MSNLNYIEVRNAVAAAGLDAIQRVFTGVWKTDSDYAEKGEIYDRIGEPMDNYAACLVGTTNPKIHYPRNEIIDGIRTRLLQMAPITGVISDEQMTDAGVAAEQVVAAMEAKIIELGLVDVVDKLSAVQRLQLNKGTDRLLR